MVELTLLIRRFGKCSLNVKLQLFRSYCMCFYGIALWCKYSATVLHQFNYCYHKCIKNILWYYSFTSVQLDLKLPCFDTVLHNIRYAFNAQWHSCASDLVQYISSIISDFIG